jgi:hypothetical protein
MGVIGQGSWLNLHIRPAKIELASLPMMPLGPLLL